MHQFSFTQSAGNSVSSVFSLQISACWVVFQMPDPQIATEDQKPVSTGRKSENAFRFINRDTVLGRSTGRCRQSEWMLGRFNIVRIGENSSYIYLEDWFHTIASQSTGKILLFILLFVQIAGKRLTFSISCLFSSGLRYSTFSEAMDLLTSQPIRRRWSSLWRPLRRSAILLQILTFRIASWHFACCMEKWCRQFWWTRSVSVSSTLVSVALLYGNRNGLGIHV